jgi:acetyltransferase-like isoleucine patch superfamily enzyme
MASTIFEYQFSDLPQSFFASGERPNGILKVSQEISNYHNFLTIYSINRYNRLDSNVITHFGDPSSRLHVGMGYGNHVDIGQHSKINANLACWAESSFVCGAHTRANGISVECRFSHLAIGSHCLLSDGITFQVSDMHCLWDLESMTALSVPGFFIDVKDDVWIGRNASIVRPVAIGRGSAVGFGSVVTKDIPEFCVVAGNPAKIIRRNVTWTGLIDDVMLRQKLERMNAQLRSSEDPSR